MTADRELDVDELRAVLGIALLGNEDDEPAPWLLVRLASGQTIEVTSATYSPTLNEIVLSGSSREARRSTWLFDYAQAQMIEAELRNRARPPRVEDELRFWSPRRANPLRRVVRDDGNERRE